MLAGCSLHQQLIVRRLTAGRSGGRQNRLDPGRVCPHRFYPALLHSHRHWEGRSGSERGANVLPYPPCLIPGFFSICAPCFTACVQDKIRQAGRDGIIRRLPHLTRRWPPSYKYFKKHNFINTVKTLFMSGKCRPPNQRLISGRRQVHVEREIRIGCIADL